LVYAELHRQAHRYLSRERSGHTLQTTELINEVFLKLIEQRNVSWESRTHFFGIAAQLMRRVLLDYARKKLRDKRGGGRDDVPLNESLVIQTEKLNFDLLALDEALTRLGEFDEQQARVVELKFFGDLTIEETAHALGVSPATVKRDWNAARAWLHHELTREINP
jgi:RNA polymerase sigma factor (TIGR02999 family)